MIAEAADSVQPGDLRELERIEHRQVFVFVHTY